MAQNKYQIAPKGRSRSPLSGAVDFLTAAHPELKDIGDRRRAQLTSGLTLVLCLFTTLAGIFASSHAILFFTSALGLVSYFISRTRYYRLAAFIFIIGYSISPYYNILTGEASIPILTVFSFIPLSLVIASALVNKWTVFLLTGLNVAAILLVMPTDPKVSVTSGVITAIGFLLAILDAVRENIENARLGELQRANRELLDIQSNLEERVAERTNELNRRSTQLEAAALVARAAAEVRDLKGLLENVVTQITDRFGFYHSGIFLTDPTGQFVILESASSSGGKKMVERGHRLEIGRQGIVGYAAYQKRPRIAQDVGVDAVFFNNPDLAQTHSEVALPLIVQNRLIGVLDIQSQERNAFSSEDVYTLQTMADQIALAIENARLIDGSRSAIEQLQFLTTEKTTENWQEYFARQVRGYAYSQVGIAPLEGETASKTIPALPERTIKTPINLRGKQIGVIALKRKQNEAPWTEAEQEMAEKISIQVALAIENARLLEESQRRAVREQTVNDLSSRFSRSLDVDTLLQNAIREIHHIRQVAEVSVYINPSDTSGKNEPGSQA
jgi:GAF domain-containing protein